MSHPAAPRRPARRTAVRSCLAVLVAVLLAACSSAVPGSPVAVDDAVRSSAPTSGGAGGITRPPGSTTPGSSAAGNDSPAAVPEGLEEYYSQELDWGSCADLATSDDTKFYRSAVAAVRRPDGPAGLRRPERANHHAEGAAQAGHRPAATGSGRWCINPGGPGVSGVENGGQLAAYGIATELNKRVRPRRVRPSRGRRVGAGHPLPDRCGAGRHPRREPADPHPGGGRRGQRRGRGDRARAVRRCPAPSRASTAPPCWPTSGPVTWQRIWTSCGQRWGTRS